MSLGIYEDTVWCFHEETMIASAARGISEEVIMGHRVAETKKAVPWQHAWCLASPLKVAHKMNRYWVWAEPSHSTTILSREDHICTYEHFHA